MESIGVSTQGSYILNTENEKHIDEKVSQQANQQLGTLVTLSAAAGGAGGGVLAQGAEILYHKGLEAGLSRGIELGVHYGVEESFNAVSELAGESVKNIAESAIGRSMEMEKVVVSLPQSFSKTGWGLAVLVGAVASATLAYYLFRSQDTSQLVVKEPAQSGVEEAEEAILDPTVATVLSTLELNIESLQRIDGQAEDVTLEQLGQVGVAYGDNFVAFQEGERVEFMKFDSRIKPPRAEASPGSPFKTKKELVGGLRERIEKVENQGKEDGVADTQ